MSMKKIIVVLSLILSIQGCSVHQNEAVVAHNNQENPYLRYIGGELISTHGLNILFKIPEEYSTKPIISYEATFNNHPFYISFAPLVAKNRLIGVHAEAVTDNSGYLNYSHLDEYIIDNIVFYRKDRCVHLDENTVNSMDDLRYMQKVGFDFESPVYLAQFFKHSDDGNKEYVLTVARHVDDCDKIDGLKEALSAEIERIIDIQLQSS